MRVDCNDGPGRPLRRGLVDCLWSQADQDIVCLLRPVIWLSNSSVFIIGFLSLLYK